MWRLSPNLSVSVRNVSRHNDVLTIGSRSCASSPKVESSVASSAEVASTDPPPPPPNGKKGGFFWKVLGLSFVGAGGVVGYAWYDSNFRKTVENNVPYSKTAFDYLSLYLPPSSGEEAMLGERSRNAESLQRTKRRNAISPAETEFTANASVQTELDVEPIEKDAEKTQRSQILKIDDILKQKELEETAAHTELESKLKLLLSDSVKYVEAAIQSLSAATTFIADHNKELSNTDEVAASPDPWTVSSGPTGYQPNSMWLSEVDADRAKLTLDKLRSVIEEGKANALTARDTAVVAAEESLNKLNYSLDTAMAQLSKVQSEAKVIMEYQNLIRKSRKQFHKELESVLPDVKISSKLLESQLSEDALNLLTAHAHRRIEQLQKQIVEHDKAEKERLVIALAQQSAENERLEAQQLERERGHLKANLSVEQLKWEEESRVEHERDMRNQLGRQAAAHSDHLRDVLQVQKRELQAAFDVFLATRLDEERSAFQKYIIGWIARMRGIDRALTDRAHIDEQIRRSQDLWVASQALQSIIVHGNGNDSHLPWENRLLALGPELEAISANAPIDSPVVSNVISSIPAVAKSRGVWTEQFLVERFAHVHEVASRVAFIGNTDSSLFGYALSYLMSFFVFRPPTNLEADDEISVDGLTPFALLSHAKTSLEQGNLEQAVRFVNQLTGEPRRVAADWLREAILLLEVKQAADVLLSFASATSNGHQG